LVARHDSINSRHDLFLANHNGSVAAVDDVKHGDYLGAASDLSQDGGRAGGVILAVVGVGTKLTPAEEPHPSITEPYKRPTGATTPEQRASVQGKACVKCGQTAPRMVAGHKGALVKEYYKTGTIDAAKMKSVKSVQSECPTCSAKEGAQMSRYSKEMKEKLKERGQ